MLARRLHERRRRPFRFCCCCFCWAGASTTLPLPQSCWSPSLSCSCRPAAICSAHPSGPRPSRAAALSLLAPAGGVGGWRLRPDGCGDRGAGLRCRRRSGGAPGSPGPCALLLLGVRRLAARAVSRTIAPRGARAGVDAGQPFWSPSPEAIPGAWFIGRAFGRRRLAPQVSPSMKTVEGLLAGLIAAAAARACDLGLRLPAASSRQPCPSQQHLAVGNWR